MSGTRVYVPSSWAGLRDLVLSGGLGPSPLLAHAVTAELRAAWPDAGEEDQEYAAMSAAARTSLACIGPEDVQRRVVIAVDADTVLQGRHQDVTVVELGEAVPYRRVAAVLTDSTDAETAVAAARAAWPAAQAGDPDAEAVVDRCQDHELGWYAAQELGDLLER